MSADATKPATILLVEDESAFRQIYRDALSSADNFNIVEAEDGEQALGLVQTQAPDIILLDLILPKVNGFDVLTQIKNDPQYTHIPIIVYSVLGDKEQIDKAIKLGASDFTIKGFTPASEVVAKVKKLLGSNAEATSSAE